ncbi:MAG: SusD/RagB family nutrient-binding outer membrane lipoprotein [Bacteroidota bacterium]
MKKILVICLAALTLTACQDLTELNVNGKVAESVEAGSLFANGTYSMFDFMASTNVNVNNFRLWAQQWAQTTYADESNYQLVERDVNGRAWNTIYATVLRDLDDAKKLIEADEVTPAAQKANQLAIVEVMSVYAWHVLVDIFGDIPYTEALGNTGDADDVTPSYDDDKEIYTSLMTRLDAAISSLSGDSGFGSFDLVYGGSADAWKKFANSLKLRMAVRMADEDAAASKAAGEAAIASGLLESSSDDFELGYQSATPHTNPLWVDLIQSGRSDFIAANTMVDKLNELSDPRVSGFYKDTYLDTLSGEQVYRGGVYGDNNNYNAFSHPGEMQLDPTFSHTMLGYTEVAFLLADAAERGWTGAGDAAENYTTGITSSILEWGGSTADADAYLAQESVSYGTAAGDWKEKIGTQKWIAMYDQGFEAWSTWRLYDAPTLNIAAQAGIETPKRYTYPVTEASLNGENLDAVKAKYPNGDSFEDKLFWDMN